MKHKNKHMDYIKANRKGSREAELECSTGWKAVRKVHKSKRTYSRKNKKSGNNPDFFVLGRPVREFPRGRFPEKCFSANSQKTFTNRHLIIF